MTTEELKKITGLTKLSDLTELAKKSGKKKVAVAVAHDEHCLEAVCAVMKKGNYQCHPYWQRKKDQGDSCTAKT